MRVVLDTNILIRGNPKTSPAGLARELLLTVVTGPHILIVSHAILVEVQRVLNYPHVKARWSLTAKDIGQFLSALENASYVVDLPSPAPSVVSDPDDDPIVQTAVLGGADVLCTRDDAFTHTHVLQACALHGIRILDDVQLMKELRQLHVRS